LLLELVVIISVNFVIKVEGSWRALSASL